MKKGTTESSFVIAALRWKLRHLRRFILLNNEMSELSLLRIEEGLFIFSKEDVRLYNITVIRALQREIELGIETFRGSERKFAEELRRLKRSYREERSSAKRELEKRELLFQRTTEYLLSTVTGVIETLEREEKERTVSFFKLFKTMERRMRRCELNIQNKVKKEMERFSEQYIERVFGELREIAEGQLSQLQKSAREIEREHEKLEKNIGSIRTETIKGKELLRQSIEKSIENSQLELKRNIRAIYSDFKKSVASSLETINEKEKSIHGQVKSFSEKLSSFEDGAERELFNFKNQSEKLLDESKTLKREDMERAERELHRLEAKKQSVISELSKIENELAGER